MSNDRKELSLNCPAKVNLALSVGPVRADGLHPIASWMVAVRFNDRLKLRRASGETSTWDVAFAEDAPVRQPVDWPADDDLACRAHRLFESHVGRPLPVEAVVSKQVPAGAGLGGGSSDAAGVLVGLNRLFDLKQPLHELMGLAGQLGSDVVFLVAALHGSPSAIVTGAGEAIEPATRSSAIALTLVLPPFGCPTGAVYQTFDEQRGSDSALDESAVRRLAHQAPLTSNGLFNDLAEPAQRVQPPLGEAVQKLSNALDMPVHITGSGAAMFVVARSPEHAQELAVAATKATGFAAVATQTLAG